MFNNQVFHSNNRLITNQMHTEYQISSNHHHNINNNHHENLSNNNYQPHIQIPFCFYPYYYPIHNDSCATCIVCQQQQQQLQRFYHYEFNNAYSPYPPPPNPAFYQQQQQPNFDYYPICAMIIPKSPPHPHNSNDTTIINENSNPIKIRTRTLSESLNQLVLNLNLSDKQQNNRFDENFNLIVHQESKDDLILESVFEN
jgi:hypothetical protein